MTTETLTLTFVPDRPVKIRWICYADGRMESIKLVQRENGDWVSEPFKEDGLVLGVEGSMAITLGASDH